MKIVTVVPLKKGPSQGELTYFTTKEVPCGSVVTVPLRNKKVLGLAISSEEAAPLKSNIKGMAFNLRKIIEIKEQSVFLKQYLDAAIETAGYYAENKNNTVTSLVPSILRENFDALAKFSRKPTSPQSGGKGEIKSEKLVLQESLADRMSFYKTLIRGSFAEKRSVFVVLPTEYDIKIFEESLSKGIEQFTFTLYGDSKKLVKKVEQVMSISHPVLIIGTPIFLSVPRHDLKTIVVEHESSGAYKLFAKPHLDLRFFAELFATKINAKLIFGDTLLRYETIARQNEGALIPVHPMRYRINFQGKIDISGRTRDRDQKNSRKEEFKVLSGRTLDEIKETVSAKRNVFVFALRKGLATMTVCRDCNETLSCEKCGAPMVLYSSHQGKKRMFVCNRCERVADGDRSCTACGSWNLAPLGIGTDTVYEYLKDVFPAKGKVRIFKLDKESAKTKAGAEKIIKEFEESPGSILVGTEMAFFYLHNRSPHKISLSVVASFDSLWSMPNYKMGEKIIQMILSITGITSDKMIIQTKNESDRALLAVKTENLLSFVREELEDRESLGYPPFKRFIKITHLGNKEQALRVKKVLSEIFGEYAPEIFSGFVSRLKDRYVTNALLKIGPEKWSLPGILSGSSLDENMLKKLISLPPSFSVFVDPEDLL